MIDTYTAALGFEKVDGEGRFSNGSFLVWDVIPRNVLVDRDGDIFVVDAEIKRIWYTRHSDEEKQDGDDGLLVH